MPLPVLVVVASEDNGGMARVAFLLAKHLPAFDVAVRFAVHREAPLTDWLRELGVEYDVVPELIETPTRPLPDGRRGVAAVARNLGGLSRAAARIREIARRHASTILYSHNTWSHFVVAAAARLSRRSAPPLIPVWHIHNDHSRLVTRLFDRAAVRLGGVASIIAVSRSIGRPFEHLRPPLVVVHNGIDVPRDATLPPPPLRVRLGIPSGAPVVAYAGRLVAHKGIHVLMDAARIAMTARPDLHVVVLGGNPRHEATDVVGELRARAGAWGLGGRLHVTGHVDEAGRWVADADVAVVPSICEDGCPLAAIEALLGGIPVIASAIGGLPEIVRDGVDGVLVAPGDANALAGAMVSLSQEPDRRRRMAQAARNAARDRFDATRMARQVALALRAAAQTAPLG